MPVFFDMKHDPLAPLVFDDMPAEDFALPVGGDGPIFMESDVTDCLKVLVGNYPDPGLEGPIS